MPSSVYLHDGEHQITVRFPTEEDRERFKAHYRALDALAVQFRAERDQLREAAQMAWEYINRGDVIPVNNDSVGAEARLVIALQDALAAVPADTPRKGGE